MYIFTRVINGLYRYRAVIGVTFLLIASPVTGFGANKTPFCNSNEDCVSGYSCNSAIRECERDTDGDGKVDAEDPCSKDPHDECGCSDCGGEDQASA